MTDPPALEAQAAIRNMAKEAADAPDQDKALREELEAEEAEKQMKKAKAKGRGKGKGKGKGKGGRGRGRGRGKKDDPEEQMPEVEVATTHDVDEVEVTKATDSPPVVEMEPPNDSLTPKSTGHKPIKRKRSKLRRLKALSPSSSAKKAAKCHAEPVAVPESQQDYQWGGTETDGDAWDGDWENWECPDAHVSGEWEKNNKGSKKRKGKKPKGNRKRTKQSSEKQDDGNPAPPAGMSSNQNEPIPKAKAKNKAKEKSKVEGQGKEEEKPGPIDEEKELQKRQEAEAKKDRHFTRWSKLAFNQIPLTKQVYCYDI